MPENRPSETPPTREDWSARYRAEHTPWDLGHPHPELQRRLDTGLLDGGGSALVPGAGLGHDAEALARAGWNVVAVDFADELEVPLGERMERVGATALITDALALQAEPFDLVFDHTFFCAIDPAERLQFGVMMDRLTGPGSLLASVVFPIGRTQTGPPWGVTVEMMTDALSADWRLEIDEAAVNPPGRGWPARWAEWRRVGLQRSP